MKKWMLLCLMLLVFPHRSLSQGCGLVLDDAHVLPVGSMQAAADKLIAQGAEPHFVTVPGKNVQNLDLTENNLEAACAATWQGVGGQRKSTLLVMMVAPESHKLGLYYGSAWHAALDDHWNRIKTDAIAPRFRDGNWAGGFTAGAEQLAARLAASKDESLHPVAATTVNQAADYSGLWGDFKFMLIIILVLGSAGFLTWLVSKWISGKGKVKGAQLDAHVAKGNAAAWLDQAKECLDELTTGDSVADGALGSNAIRDRDQKQRTGQTRYSNLQAEYAMLISSSRMDPAENGLPVEVYRSMAKQYDAISVKARALESYLTGSGDRYTLPKDNSPEEIKQRSPKGTESWTTGWNPGASYPNQSSSSTVIINETNVEDSRSLGATEAPRDDTAQHSWSSSSDSGGGGSSSWSSSDSGSDWGGSSSFDSGGSFGGNSGGGGSSDF